MLVCLDMRDYGKMITCMVLVYYRRLKGANTGATSGTE